MNKLLTKSAWVVVLSLSALVGYTIIKDIPEKAKEQKQRAEQFQKRQFALRVKSQDATVSSESIKLAEGVEVVFKGDTRPASMPESFWLMNNVRHTYACVQTAKFDCYEVVADEKALAAIRLKAKDGVELQNDMLTKSAWNNFVIWDKQTNELGLGEKILIKTLIHLL